MEEREIRGWREGRKETERLEGGGRGGKREIRGWEEGRKETN